MKLSKARLSGLVLIIPVLATSILFAQESRITRRVMTEEEFSRLKEREGVCEEGKNYNIIIDGYGTGLQPPTEEEWQEIRRMTIVVDRIEFSRDGAPSSHDNSASNWFPPIGNQGGEGSCVSWACGYYTKTFQEAREHHWNLSGSEWIGGYSGEPSTDQDRIFSPDFIYHQVNGGGDNGSKYSDNMNLLERIGCCTWEKMPYRWLDSDDWPEEDAWREAPLYRSETGHDGSLMEVDTDARLDTLKQWLADSNLAIISVDAYYYDYLTSEDLWTTDNYGPSDETNHANTIVGYDDSLGPYTEGGNPDTYGAFKVANSWGAGTLPYWENVWDGFYYISYECMKQRIVHVRVYENKIGYEPEIISVFQLTHSRRNECQVTVAIGQIGSADFTKRFDEYESRGGPHPFPTNKMVMDITEFTPFMSGPPDNFFLKIRDVDTDSTGTIDFFSIEKYGDYASGIATKTYVSIDPPESTVNGSNVYAQVASGLPESLWIVGDGGSPGDLITAEVWLLYEGNGPDDSISSFDIPLTWDAAVCTVETLTVGPDFSEWTNVSRIDNWGTQGPPAVPKVGISSSALEPPYSPQLPPGTYLAATIHFRILDTVLPPDSTYIDTLMEAFTPPIYLGFTNKNGVIVYVPVFSKGCVEAIQYDCGDCNGDEKIDFADALYVKNYYFQTPPGSAAPIGEGDVNLDGAITFADALYIKNYYFQTPPGSAPPCEPPLGLTPMIDEKQMER